jgi:FtsP/CotA-like multicopper oxidase with cupredoxin domain
MTTQGRGRTVKRREFLRYGVATVGAGLLASAPAHAATQSFRLDIEPVDVEMIDGQIVFHLLYYMHGGGSSRPRPIITARQGDTIVMTVRNRSEIICGFTLPGVNGATISNLMPDQEAQITFIAPRSGTYLYFDPTNGPANRLAGLHGAFVSLPTNPTTPAGAQTPYSRGVQTAEVRAVFDALGKPGRFPGQGWNPNDRDRDLVWLFASCDPSLNARFAAGQLVDGSSVQSQFLPRYFTLNGLSGIDSSHDPRTQPRGYQGQPTLIRTLNAGGVTHSAHIHGNHVLRVADGAPGALSRCSNNIWESDVWPLPPLTRADVLLPFERPPDAAVWPPTEEPFPMRYVMHCHTEMSQTAGGGNYPMGIVTHWEMLGPLQNNQA